MRSCERCGRRIDHLRPHARYCGSTCRGRAADARREAVLRARALELLSRHERAHADGGDPVVLAAITRDAERLFGGSTAA